jgi:hypothetical protein
VIVAALVLAAAAWAGTRLGSEDDGFVPPGGTQSRVIGRCELGASKAARRYFDCIMRCHDKRASGKLAEDEECEVVCAQKHIEATDKLRDCPPCLDHNRGGLIEPIESFVDTTVSGQTYCASPSGAFVDGATGF